MGDEHQSPNSCPCQAAARGLAFGFSGLWACERVGALITICLGLPPRWFELLGAVWPIQQAGSRRLEPVLGGHWLAIWQARFVAIAGVRAVTRSGSRSEASRAGGVGTSLNARSGGALQPRRSRARSPAVVARGL